MRKAVFGCAVCRLSHGGRRPFVIGKNKRGSGFTAVPRLKLKQPIKEIDCSILLIDFKSSLIPQHILLEINLKY